MDDQIDKSTPDGQDIKKKKKYNTKQAIFLVQLIDANNFGISIKKESKKQKQKPLDGINNFGYRARINRWENTAYGREERTKLVIEYVIKATVIKK